MMAFLFSRVGAALAGVLVLAGVMAYTHYAAYQRGAAAERTAALQKSVELLRERNATDEQIRDMDDRQLCVALGGRLSDDGTCE
ncbi:hypothetical protein [Mesorhizobium xinjiangense]|uniref:hypothetical protein n=1 Tax=Mesorhizobium xinjiangense TaxID=2678685 RepID=UPI0012EDFE9F|nr:hypothetical protein [Mesorhizobium xinjiangense]